jgi:hypothetical protein
MKEYKCGTDGGHGEQLGTVRPHLANGGLQQLGTLRPQWTVYLATVTSYPTVQTQQKKALGQFGAYIKRRSGQRTFILHSTSTVTSR